MKLLWTRDDDLQNDFYRPFGVHACVRPPTRTARLTGWSHRVAATSRKFRADRDDDPDWVGTLDVDGFPANCVPNYLAEFVNVDFGLARGWWRAPLHTFAAFATQSFVDEVAVAVKRDPLELRLEMLGAPRDLEYREHGGSDIQHRPAGRGARGSRAPHRYGRKLAQGTRHRARLPFHLRRLRRACHRSCGRRRRTGASSAACAWRMSGWS